MREMTETKPLDRTRRGGGAGGSGSWSTTAQPVGSKRVRERKGQRMKRVMAGVLSAFVFTAFPVMGNAADTCPPEVGQAKAMLNKQARGQDAQAPRSLAGARVETQAPRSQEVQAPRSLAGARSQDAQAPR